MIKLAEDLAIDEAELVFSFVRASGPGGQNVNKVASAAQLRFDARNSPSLPPALAERLIHLAGRRATTEGVIVIDARRFRSQERNRADALARLVALIGRAACPPPPRKPTRVPAAERRRRRDAKARRSALKAQRAALGDDD